MVQATIDDRLIETLYGAVDNDARWGELMNVLKQRLGVHSAVGQLLISGSGCSPVGLMRPMWTARDSDSERAAALHDSWAGTPANPRYRRPHGTMPEIVIGSDQQESFMTGADRENLRQGLARCGLGPAFWLSLRLDDARRFTLIFHRQPGDTRDISAQEQAQLTALSPHVRQAVRLWTRLVEAESRAALIERAGEEQAIALVACDRHLRVHWMNAAARGLLCGVAPVFLRCGHLATAQREDGDRLHRLVSADAPDEIAALGQDWGDAIHVRAQSGATLASRMGLAPELVVLAMTRPAARRQYHAAAIAHLFGLTMTEAALAADLAGGGTLQDFARTREIAEGTARLHLKRVLAKTGAGRQSELVRRIGQSVATTH